ncbi:MAG: ABC-type transport auxiliary lipoprotein family protein [Wenzhouxiangellaceae bacterium]|nr:ABC-type transport auxiliary lipoprotein family protein [Wenzhouxiangellaceae bacterium]
MKPGPVSLVTLVLLASIGAGCSVFPESAPMQLLDPRLPPADAAAGAGASWSLDVARPEADPMRDSTRVLVRTGGGRLQVHASARWVAASPDLFRTLLVRYMRDREMLEGVGGDVPLAERTLALDLRRFELAEDDGGSLAADIRIEARLYDSASAELLARRLFEARRSIPSSDAAAISAGFETALAEIIPATAEWAVAHGRAD